MSEENRVQYGVEFIGGHIVTSKDYDIIIGNIMSVIEILGLGETRENATKSQVRQILDRGIHKNNVFIDSELHAEKWMEEENILDGKIDTSGVTSTSVQTTTVSYSK